MIENWSVNFFLDSTFILIMRPFEVPVQLLPKEGFFVGITTRGKIYIIG